MSKVKREIHLLTSLAALHSRTSFPLTATEPLASTSSRQNPPMLSSITPSMPLTADIAKAGFVIRRLMA